MNNNDEIRKGWDRLCSHEKIPTDYDSPIVFNFVQQIATEIAKQTDESVMKAVMNTGINIDQKKLVEALQQDKERYDDAYQKGYLRGYNRREEEIVRCKDCTDWKRRECGTYGYCEQHDGFYDQDWFCADAVRKAEEEDE